MFSKILKLSFMAIIGGFVAATPAHAAFITYDVNGTIDGGGTISGEFIADEDPTLLTVPVTSVSLLVTPGIGYGGLTISGTSSVSVLNDLNVANGPLTGTVKAGAGDFSPTGGYVQFSFLYPSGGPIITKTNSSFGESFYAPNAGGTFFISGTVTEVSGISAVPLPASLPMFFIAVAALVGLGLTRSRRVN